MKTGKEAEPRTPTTRESEVFRDPRAVAITAAVRGMLKSSTIIRGLGGTKEVVMARLRNPHPGEILKEEFLSAIGMSQNQLAL
jgi:hypothetical protein